MLRRLSNFAICAATVAMVTLGACNLFAQEAKQGPTGKDAPKDVKQGPTDKDAPKEFTTTESGLKYKILRKSTGKKAAKSSIITIHYRGWLDSGSEFDSSYVRGKPATYPLGKLVKGWQEGIPLVGEGGMIELEIPSKDGYGPDGRPPYIPPDATLHFIIEVITVK